MEGKLKLLIVDDNPDILAVLESRIMFWGYEVRTATNGPDAIRMVKEEKPHILILDYKMTPMDGVETLREIRKFNDDLKVILFTGFPDEKAIMGTEGLNISFFITKGATYSETDEALKSAIESLAKKIEPTDV